VWTSFMGSSQWGQLACGCAMGGHSSAQLRVQRATPILTISARAVLPEDGLGPNFERRF